MLPLTSGMTNITFTETKSLQTPKNKDTAAYHHLVQWAC